MMCEVPSNALLADEFLDIFDGLLDRLQRPDPAHAWARSRLRHRRRLFDERDPAVKKMLSMAIQTAKKKGKYIGICGQGRRIIRTWRSG
jgi:pyruvate,water dikinase